MCHIYEKYLIHIIIKLLSQQSPLRFYQNLFHVVIQYSYYFRTYPQNWYTDVTLKPIFDSCVVNSRFKSSRIGRDFRYDQNLLQF